MDSEWAEYALFGFSDYYPCGGMFDLDGFYSTVEEAQEHAKERRWDSAQIVDTTTWEIVQEWDGKKWSGQHGETQGPGGRQP